MHRSEMTPEERLLADQDVMNLRTLRMAGRAWPSPPAKTARDSAAWDAVTFTALRRFRLAGCDEHVRSAPIDITPSVRTRLANLPGCLGNPIDHLNHRQRLAAGRSFGSGQLEGGCEHMIGRPLKPTRARRRIRRINRMAGRCSHDCDACWAIRGV